MAQATHSVHARWLSNGHSSIREDLLSRWPEFFRSLLTGPSPEAATLARVSAGDRWRTTAANNALILSATGLSTWTATTAEVPAELQSREVAMAPEETSKVDYLLELLQTRAELSLQCEDITRITAHIDFLVIF